MVLSLLVSAYELCRLAMPNPEGPAGGAGWWVERLGVGGPEVAPGLGSDIQAALERALPDLHQAVSAAKQAAGPDDLQARLAEILALVEEAWQMPAVGREVAKGLCDALRLEGGLDLLLALLQGAEPGTRSRAAQLLEQVLVAENRGDMMKSLFSPPTCCLQGARSRWVSLRKSWLPARPFLPEVMLLHLCVQGAGAGPGLRREAER